MSETTTPSAAPENSAAKSLAQRIQTQLGAQAIGVTEWRGETTVEVLPENWLSVAGQLRDADEFHFEQLLDVCGVDYLSYGQTEVGYHRRFRPTGFLAWRRRRRAGTIRLVEATTHWCRAKTLRRGSAVAVDQAQSSCLYPLPRAGRHPPGGAVVDRPVAGFELVRARGVRSVRHLVRRASGFAQDSHRLWFCRPSFSQGFR